jgi:ubiquinone/menaquinone biosynthesis C-methylase UbiE
MVRRLAKSNAFGKVVAVDFSESMLEEVERRRQEERCPTFDMVRADVANLPFATDALDAIHSGAALHCWPYVQDGLKEVHRVLKPGGAFSPRRFCGEFRTSW